MTMRSWLPVGCAALVLALGGAALWSSHKSPSKSAARGADKNELEELRARLSQLQNRVSSNERVVGDLAFGRTDAAAAAASANAMAAAAASPSSPASDEEEPRPLRPTRALQKARFERHFAELDALRGTEPDVDTERKLRALLADSAAQKLTALPKAKLDRVSCGNQLCRVDMTFTEGNVRMGQTELQIQLASLNRGATVYVDDDSGQLHAYFNTGDAQFPPFPTVAEVSVPDKGG